MADNQPLRGIRNAGSAQRNCRPEGAPLCVPEGAVGSGRYAPSGIETACGELSDTSVFAEASKNVTASSSTPPEYPITDGFRAGKTEFPRLSTARGKPDEVLIVTLPLLVAGVPTHGSVEFGGSERDTVVFVCRMERGTMTRLVHDEASTPGTP